VLTGLCRGPRPLRYQYKFGAQISSRIDAHLSLTDRISTPTLDRGRGGGRWHCITDISDASDEPLKEAYQESLFFEEASWLSSFIRDGAPESYEAEQSIRVL